MHKLQHIAYHLVFDMTICFDCLRHPHQARILTARKQEPEQITVEQQSRKKYEQ